MGALAPSNSRSLEKSVVWPPKKNAVRKSDANVASMRYRGVGGSPPGVTLVQAADAGSYSHVSLSGGPPTPPNSTSLLRLSSKVIPYRCLGAGRGLEGISFPLVLASSM